jgi:flavin-dependent dehydrogenase
MDRHDVIVVGARPAGTTMASLLAKEGFRVLLLDRAIFPKTTLSCPIYFANAFAILNRIGVMGAVDAVGAPKLRLYQVQFADVDLRGRMLPYEGYDYAYHIRREIFDELMFRHAEMLPKIETRMGFHVRELIWESNRVVGVRGRGGGGPVEEIRADAVVGADGIFSTVAEKAGAAKYDVLPARTCIYYSHYENVGRAGTEATATVYYDVKEKFAFVTANGEGDLTVISLSLPASRFEEARANHESLHCEYAKKIPAMAERMQNAFRVAPVSGVSPRDSFYRVPFGNGWVLVGDAGYYKDPLPGQGIHDALRSAELATEAFVEYRKNGATPGAWDKAFRKYHTRRDRETRAMYALTDELANMDLERTSAQMDFFRAIAAMPDWSDRYVSMYNGATSVEWFRRPDTVMRILATWRWRKLMGPSRFGRRRQRR